MNRSDYMDELRKRLESFGTAKDETRDALLYYEEYFNEAGPEGEQEAIKKLGSPAFVAAQVSLSVSKGPDRLTEKKARAAKGSGKLIKAVAIGVAAAPVALPLAFAAAAVIFTLIIAAFSVVFAFSASGLACIATGIFAMFGAVRFVISDSASALFFFGAGLVTIGTGGLLMRFGLWLGRLCVRAITSIGARFIRRSSRGAYVPVEKREVAVYAGQN